MSKPSSTNKKQLKDRILFVDRNLIDLRFCPILERAGFVLRTLEEPLFRDDCPDVEWIPKVAGWGWIIITRDKNITKDRAELEVCMESDARLIMPGGAQHPVAFAEILARTAIQLNRYLLAQEKYAEKIDGCFTRVYPSEKDPTGPGVVKDWKTKAEWQKILAKRNAKAER